MQGVLAQMVERSLCMREVSGSMPGSSIYLYEDNYDSNFKASTITTKITVNLNSQSTLCNGFLFYCMFYLLSFYKNAVYRFKFEPAT